MNKDIKELLFLADELLDTIIEEDIFPLMTKKAAKELSDLRHRLSTVGCWIPCDADNPPPADTPMLVWCPSCLSGWVRYPAKPEWCPDGWKYMIPGVDFSHYIILEEPTE